MVEYPAQFWAQRAASQQAHAVVMGAVGRRGPLKFTKNW